MLEQDLLSGLCGNMAWLELMDICRLWSKQSKFL